MRARSRRRLLSWLSFTGVRQHDVSWAHGHGTADESVLGRLLKVGSVDFDTARTDDSEFRFVGVNRPGDVVAAVERAQAESMPTAI